MLLVLGCHGFCRGFFAIAREALLLGNAQLRIKNNLDCAGLLITGPTTLIVWKLGDSVPDDSLLVT